MSKKLCEKSWFKNDSIYKNIYNIINVGGMLPDPCEITVLDPEYVPEETTGYFGRHIHAFCNKATKELWFEQQPPDYVAFAHELMHLIDKEYELEEIYSYNISPFVVLLAENGIIPKINPTKLFQADMKTLLEALSEVYGYPFKDIAEYFQMIGVIPLFLNMKFDPAKDDYSVTYNPMYDEKAIIIHAIGELTAGAEYDKAMFRALVRLLEKLEQKEGGGKQ